MSLPDPDARPRCAELPLAHQAWPCWWRWHALRSQGTAVVGNFWVDVTRGTLYVLLPLSTPSRARARWVWGVVQSFAPYRAVPLVEPLASSAR